MVDIFPSVKSTRVSLIRRPKDVKDFKTIFNSTRVIPTKAYLENGKLYYENVSVNGLAHHFNFVGKQSVNFYEAKFRPKSLAWEDVAQRLQRERRGKKNADVRLSFRFDQNTFLVKKYFTFGRRWVEPGTQHVFQTTDVPLLFFVLKSQFVEKPKLANRTFVPEDRSKYRRFILMPNSQYVVNSNTHYVLITTQQALFSVDVIDKNTPLPFECLLSPLTTKDWIFRPAYGMTPSVDRMNDDALLMPPPPRKYLVEPCKVLLRQELPAAPPSDEEQPELPKVSSVEQEPELPQVSSVEQEPELPQVSSVEQEPELPQVSSVEPEPELPQVSSVESESLPFEAFKELYTESSKVLNEPEIFLMPPEELEQPDALNEELDSLFPPAKRIKYDDSFVEIYQQLTRKKEFQDPKLDLPTNASDKDEPLDLSSVDEELFQFIENWTTQNFDMQNFDTQNFDEIYESLKDLIE